MKALLVTLAAILGLASPLLRADTQETPIRAGDRINITVAGIPPEDAQAINHAYPVSEKGSIKVLYLDNLAVAGTKASELAQKIEGQYMAKGIYTHLTVTVTLGTDIDNRVIYVMGEVIKPGAIAFRDRLTVSKAISTASGPTAFGHMSRVKLKRAGKPVHILNLSKADSPDGDIALEPEDEIIVPP